MKSELMSMTHREKSLANCHDKTWRNTWKVLWFTVIFSVSFIYNLIYICKRILRNQAHKQQ